MQQRFNWVRLHRQCNISLREVANCQSALEASNKDRLAY